MIYGTEWTAPNTGATVADLCHALNAAGRSETKRLKALRDVHGPDARTNLRLTGDRLVDYDEERIAACYVTLGDIEAQP